MLRIIRNYGRWVYRRLNIVSNLTAENIALRHLLVLLTSKQNRPYLQVCVVPGLAPPYEECDDDKKQPIHLASFHFKTRGKRPVNRGYSKWIHFRPRSHRTQLRGNPTLPLQKVYIRVTNPNSENAAYALHGVIESAGL